MANRRMFSLKVIDTDIFLDMSPSAQNLYFHLGMRADDDGFVASPKKIMVMTNASEDDMKVLMAKNFVIQMSTNGVSVITHWHMNNLIRPDRYQETEYKEEKTRLRVENGKYTADFNHELGIPNVIPEIGTQNGSETAPQVRLGKVRLGKNTQDAKASRESEDFIRLFRGVNPTYERLLYRKNQRESSLRLLELHDHPWWANFMAVYSVKMRQDRFCPKATTPLQMEEQLGKIVAYGVGLQASEIKNKVKVI